MNTITKMGKNGNTTVLNHLTLAPIIYASSAVNSPVKTIKEIINNLIIIFTRDDST